MGKANFSDEFKRDAVAQIAERGYPASEVSQRLLCLAEEPADPAGSQTELIRQAWNDRGRYRILMES